MIGETIREFEILSELGVGGYGAVYRAHDSSVDRDVAIKVILPQYADQEDFKQRFESEARLVAQLESRQIVPLYSYWQDEQGAFLVMRYIRGGSLRHIMFKQGALSLAQTIRVVSDIAEALSVAHEHDVVHRDLKPENILIDERGNAYLTDFGIAKRTSEADNITDADAIIGTWAYLSPEQIQSTDVSPQTDIYAFGILLYEILAGKHPFQGISATAMIMKHLQEALPDLSDERPDLPPQLDEIIEKATAKNPQERYASTVDLIADLKMVANESSARIAPIQTIQRKKATSPEERNRFAMLQNVRKFWIEGVLNNSVQDALLLNLRKSDASSQIENPWETVVRTPNSKDETLSPDASILNIFERMNGKLLILGEPGGGKTTSLLELARELLNQVDTDDAHPLPIIFNLSSWADKQAPLENWLAGELSNKYQVPNKVATAWVKGDELLLLLDGLDEVKAEARDACVEAINAYRTEHGFVDIVVCSRIHDYEDLSDKLLLNGAIIIQPLSDMQIDIYLEQVGSNADVPRQLITTDPELRELARTPLMLNIITNAYRDATSEDMSETATLEERRQQVFELYVENTLIRRGKSDYALEDTKHYLNYMADVMQKGGQSILQVEDMADHWLPDGIRVDRILGVIGLILNFIPGFITAIGFWQVFGIAIGWTLLSLSIMMIMTVVILTKLNRSTSYSGNLGIGFLTALPTGVLITFGSWNLVEFSLLPLVFITITSYFGISTTMFYTKLAIHFNVAGNRAVQIDRLRFDASSMQLIIMPFGAVLIISIIIFFSIFMIQIEIANLVLACLIGGGVGALLFYLASGLTSDQIEQRHNFAEGLRSSLQAANISAISGMLVVLVPLIIALLIMNVTIVDILIFCLAIAVGAFFLEWFAIGGTALLVVITIYYQLRFTGYIPKNPKNFLQYATELILLRRVGGGYMFIHRYLLEYFADLEIESESD